MKTFNKIAVKAYKKERKLEAKVNTGFATTKQKSTLVGLEVLADAVLLIGSEIMEIRKGSTAFFKEEDLYANQWARYEYDVEGLEDKFALAEPNYLIMVKDANQKTY